MARTILLGPPVIFGPEPSFFIRFPDWKVPRLGQRGNDVNVAGFFAVHGIFIFSLIVSIFVISPTFLPSPMMTWVYKLGQMFFQLTYLTL